MVVAQGWEKVLLSHQRPHYDYLCHECKAWFNGYDIGYLYVRKVITKPIFDPYFSYDTLVHATLQSWESLCPTCAKQEGLEW